jgi:hypothetical protein
MPVAMILIYLIFIRRLDFSLLLPYRIFILMFQLLFICLNQERDLEEISYRIFIVSIG